MKRARAQTRRAGFTLVELMVAMIAGSFVVVGAYYLSNVSSRVFSEQLRRSETQMSLRSTAEQLRRDLGRAAYLSVRDTSELRGCDTSAPLGTYGTTNDVVSPRAVFAVRVAMGTHGQELTITGNLTTNEHYFVVADAADPLNLPLQNTNEGYRRSFIDPTSGAFLSDRFLEAFTPDPSTPLGGGRMLSVADLDRTLIFLRDIVGVNTGTLPPSIVLGTPLPTNASPRCMSFGPMVVAPVSMFRYAVEDAVGAGLERVGGKTYLTGQSATGAQHPVLVRRELDMRTGAPIAGTERVMLDYIIAGGLVVEAVYDANPDPAVTALMHTIAPEALVNPGTIRSVIITLTVESAENAEGSALARQGASAARRALRFEVMLPNAARNSGAF